MGSAVPVENATSAALSHSLQRVAVQQCPPTHRAASTALKRSAAVVAFGRSLGFPFRIICTCVTRTHTPSSQPRTLARRRCHARGCIEGARPASQVSAEQALGRTSSLNWAGYCMSFGHLIFPARQREQRRPSSGDSATPTARPQRK